MGAEVRRRRALAVAAVLVATALVVARADSERSKPSVVGLLRAPEGRTQPVSTERFAWSSARPRIYDRFGPYLAMSASNAVESRPGVLQDVKGIPLLTYPQGRFYNPTSVSQYGLWHHAAWLRSRSDGHRRKVLEAANWLVSRQSRDGCWAYNFEYTVGKMGSSPGVTLKPPWCSAMAQGQGISLLVRAWRLSNDGRLLQAARRAVRPLTIDVARGGLRQRLAGGAFLEEYPTRPASHVLNGFMFTLFGLWDLAPWSPDAAALYRQGRATLLRALPLYDRGPGQLSAYHLGFRTAGQPVHTSPGYNDVHRTQLRALDAIEPDPALTGYRRRWRVPG